MAEVSEHARRYWQYEYTVSADYMVPLLEQWGIALPGRSVLDVGCGEGGGLCALFDHGAAASGFDIDQDRLQIALELKGERAIRFAVGNMYEERLPFADAKYDLVVLHDVFEHLDHKVRMLHILRRYLKPGGVMLITFPPYYSAYGAHQQHLLTWFARLPFVHLVPFGTSAVLPRLRNEYPHVLEEVRKLTRLKMGIAAFERLVSEGGLRIVQVKSYLISPNHVRFGLKPVSAWFFAKVPYLKEVLCSGVVYLLSE